MAEPVESSQERGIDYAQKRFRARCRVILRTAYADADQISSSIGQVVGVDEAFETWKEALRKLLDQG